MTNMPTFDVSRRGKWTREEELYAKQLITYFETGLLPIDEGTSLRNLLAQLLKCDPMRITKKFTGEYAIGKREFSPVSPTVENLALIKAAQDDLITLRDEWLAKKTYGSRMKRKAEASDSGAEEECFPKKRTASEHMGDFRGIYSVGSEFVAPFGKHQQYVATVDNNDQTHLLLHNSACGPAQGAYSVSPSNVIGDRRAFGGLGFSRPEMQLLRGPLPSEIYHQMVYQKVMGPTATSGMQKLPLQKCSDPCGYQSLYDPYSYAPHPFDNRGGLSQTRATFGGDVGSGTADTVYYNVGLAYPSASTTNRREPALSMDSTGSDGSSSSASRHWADTSRSGDSDSDQEDLQNPKNSSDNDAISALLALGSFVCV
jgi:hypothetical protein